MQEFIKHSALARSGRWSVFDICLFLKDSHRFCIQLWVGRNGTSRLKSADCSWVFKQVCPFICSIYIKQRYEATFKAMAVWLFLVISKGFVRWTWDKHREDATDAGVLDGHVDTSPLDLKESADFLDALRSQKHGDFMIWFFDWSTTTSWPKHFLCVVWGFLGDVFCVDSFDFFLGQTGEVGQV